ncbi:SMI1/KNR4 family protein [Gemmata sp. JC717]|uniref:SMI1/KNR4 family protein n=1 Tax=Gemmata algarum TaxID=2975278 RepID=UPI0021BB6CE2|nr:SMI1/KNR4 family protein [Gemmata algarum]MDY3552992.1 SMI1/KNR4 family protein [Gemmata algarum]
MAEAKPWDAVFSQVRLFRSPGGAYDRSLQTLPATVDVAGESRWLAWGRRNAEPAISDLINEAEQKLETRFPESYRAFMLRFGSGELESRFDILHPTGTDRWHNLLDYTRHLRRYFRDDVGEDYTNSDWLGQLIYFGSDEFGDAYAWHPLEMTSIEPHECRFYRLRRADEENPEVVGAAFPDFLRWAAADEARSRSEEPTEAANNIWFAPCPLWIREKPKHSDVQRWLFFNNRTARLIAKSIRHEGRADAFPILADALQDAGCTHADLLDACRTGDPDIDGRWVLQVLLGDQ